MFVIEFKSRAMWWASLWWELWPQSEGLSPRNWSHTGIAANTRDATWNGEWGGVKVTPAFVFLLPSTLASESSINYTHLEIEGKSLENAVSLQSTTGQRRAENRSENIEESTDWHNSLPADEFRRVAAMASLRADFLSVRDLFNVYFVL